MLCVSKEWQHPRGTDCRFKDSAEVEDRPQKTRKRRDILVYYSALCKTLSQELLRTVKVEKNEISRS